MCVDCKNNELVVNVDRYDPTRTTVLRNSFVNESNRRFMNLSKLIMQEIGVNDILELQSTYITIIEKIERFKEWIKNASNSLILEEIRTAHTTKNYPNWWWNKYATEAYNRGKTRARNELRKIGINVPKEFDRISVNVSSFDEETLKKQLYNIFVQLQGVTDSMAVLMSKIVAEGIMNGDGALVTARNLIKAMNGVGTLDLVDKLGRFIPAKRRAQIIARTETIRSYHLAAVNEYRSWGIYGVTVMAEWKTAGDARVCESCLEHENIRYTLDEIEKMIPFHPQCRCVALPIVNNAKFQY